MEKIILLNKAEKICGVILTLGILLGLNPAGAEETPVSSDEYRNSCASCHGMEGKGDGPMAKFLTIKPADLTLLAKNNGGQYPNLKAGQFPLYRVFQVIDGRTLVSGHGDRAMPVWGDRYTTDEGTKHGPEGMEREVRSRILELVYYLQTLQQN